MKLDVRSKVLLVLFANLAFLFRVSGWLELIIVSGLATLLYFAGKGKIAVYSLLSFVLFWTLDAYLTVFFFSTDTKFRNSAHGWTFFASFFYGWEFCF